MIREGIVYVKKIIALCLSVVMVLGITMFAFASERNNDLTDSQVLVSKGTIPVEDENGNILHVVISEYVDENSIIKNGAVSRGIFPDDEVGTKKTYTVDIGNEELTGIASGIIISQATFSKIARIAGDAIAKKIGGAWIPGLAAASTIVTLVGVWNMVAGNEGFTFTIKLEYGSTYISGQGHDMYGWDIIDASMETY